MSNIKEVKKILDEDLMQLCFENEVNFDFYLDKPEQVRIEIYDISGRIISNTSLDFDNGINNYNWISDNSIQGMLLYKVSIGNQMFYGKMIKK